MVVTNRLLRLTRDNRLTLTATILFGLAGGLLTIWQADSLSRVVDEVFLGGQNLAGVSGFLRLLILIILFRSILIWAGEVSANMLAARIKSDLRQRLFDKILCLGPAYTRGERTGELMNTVVEGVEALDAYFSQYLPQLVISALVPLSILVVVFPRDPLSGLVLLLTAPLIPVFMYLIGKTAEALTRRQWDMLGRLGAHFLDSLQGLRTLKELGRSQEQAQSIAESSDRFRNVTLKVLRVTFLSALVLELVATLSTAVVAVEVGLRLLYGHLVFQQALFLLLLAPEFYLPLRMLGLRFHAGMSGTAAARRIFEILDKRDEKAENLGKEIEPAESFNSLRITNVCYTYPGENQPALQNVSIEITAGEHIALVGPSGAGKSTLVALLLGFISPDKGQITINREPFRFYSLDAWRGMVAWVPQEPHLFHDTIAANLRLAKPDATEAELDAAARAASIYDFIHSLPAGYETVVGEAGARLSAGQAQRMALARAFLKNSPILILDEPTSALDPQNETLFEESVRGLMNGRTVITIAHRLNTVFQAGRIFVLDRGLLIETGTHRDLLANGGIYSRMVNVVDGTVDTAIHLQRFEEGERTAALDLKTTGFALTHPHQHVFFRLFGFLRGSWGWVALSTLLGVLTVGSNVGLMGTSAFLISAAALRPELGALQVAIVGVRFFGIARGVFRYTERLATHDVTFRLLARLRTWFFQSLEPLAPARLIQYHSGDLTARIIADVDTLENFYVRLAAPPVVAVVVATGMIVFFNQFDFSLALVYFPFMLALGLGVPLISWTLSRRGGAELISRRAGLQSLVVDGIQGLADLLVFNRGRDYSNRIATEGGIYGRIQVYLAILSGISSALAVMLVNLGMLSVLVLSIPLVTAGRIPATMLAVLALTALAGFEVVLPLPLAAQTLSSNHQAGRRLFELVDAKPAVLDPSSAAKCPSRTPELEFSQIRFVYPGSDRAALDEIDFSLPPGKHLAIVGPSGAGKSTVANLLLRFWDYNHGKILLDGIDLHEYAQEDVRSLVSVISQKSYFFNDTIRRNLLLARPTASDSQVQEAVERAQIDGFISGLPNGYETVIGERGLRLSGGERQRLALARAFLKDAPILLLDEPTANLDPVTERLILNMLFKSTRSRSLLLVTHRLVGLEHMDEIIVLEAGIVAERGTHSDLLSVGGLYYNMWNLQERILVDKMES